MPERRSEIQPTSSENSPAKITDMMIGRDHVHGQKLHHPDRGVDPTPEEGGVTEAQR
jgi:hypothetical protein